MSWTSYFSVLISLHHFLLFFDAVGKIIPVRYLLGVFMCLQFFIGPSLSYNGFDEYQYIVYRMKIPENEYFAYAIPAVLSFIIGLHLNSKGLAGESVDQEKVTKFVNENPKLPYYFLAIGFVASITSGFFSSDLAFVFYLIGSFKFIGLFLLVLGGKYLKPLPLTLVIGSIVSSSLGDGMFHDLLTWVIFVACVYGVRYRFGVNIKLMGLGIFIVFATVIQQMKGIYRESIGSEGAGIETFGKLLEQQNEQNGIFSFESLAPSVTRINQGFIITNIMNTVPDKVPFSNGEEMRQIFEAAFLPRILAPNKLNAGDREVFTKWSGIKLRAGTSMGLSSLGDAYLNFGVLGGCIFMFLLGLSYNNILKVFHNQGKTYPILPLFTTLVFYYPIRPDCELQTILGHLVKSCFLIYVMILFSKDMFSLKKKESFLKETI
ncbi:hypothetical protein LK994_12480 [Ferruginibacter lapsinanis]|uniref:hypothetical protein n=1 Tax=Ferruginibacter lapsinanis TaxID=563172 RepID=UPI001E2CE8B0|nr:hypothetical protein [Ferruginibacter lapsinanis]UEG49449.1 hypothetical protein LK994_12480 [Ferruginibacter lapsinanis]